jgi:hypothetical protein
LTDDERDHVAKLSAERDAHAEFVGPLTHRVRHGSVDANDGDN